MARQAADGSGLMFDRIAGRYDLINRLLSGGTDVLWRRKLVRALDLAPGATVLDLATGTADVALEVARRTDANTVLGTNPSTEMLSVGQRKVADAGLESRVTLSEGTAESIDLPDDAVDGITIAFGIRNVQDRPAALREMARVTKPGGRVAILELSSPRSGVVGKLAHLHVHHIVPRLGGLLSGQNEYRYLEQSIAAFPPAHEFAELMTSCGLGSVSIHPLTFGVAHIYVATAEKAL